MRCAFVMSFHATRSSRGASDLVVVSGFVSVRGDCYSHAAS